MPRKDEAPADTNGQGFENFVSTRPTTTDHAYHIYSARGNPH